MCELIQDEKLLKVNTTVKSASNKPHTYTSLILPVCIIIFLEKGHLANIRHELDPLLQRSCRYDTTSSSQSTSIISIIALSICVLRANSSS